MKLETIAEIIEQIDALTDKDFRLLKYIVLIRGMARELKIEHRAAPRGAQENEAYYRLNKGLQPDSQDQT